MSKVDDPPGRFSLSAGGLVGLMQRWLRGPESTELSIPVQILIAFCLLWLPLFALSLFDGSFSGTSVSHPFITDIVPQVRFLIAIPLLLYADLIIDPVTSIVVRNIKNSGIVPEEAQPELEAALTNLHRAKDSIWPDIIIVMFAFCLTWVLKPGYGDLELEAGTTSWILDVQEGGIRYSAAGWWYLLVSGPMFQVILFRWIWRYLIWAVFLYRVSRISLALRPTHPDLAGGLGYLGLAQQSFVAVFVAFTTVASSTIAHDILAGDETFRDVVPEILILVLLFIAIIYAPLLFFSKQLLGSRRSALDEYGLLGDGLSEAFHLKWIRGSNEGSGKDLLSSADPSAVADYAAVYENVRLMRTIPVTLRNVLTVTGILVVPFVPLTLTEFSLHDLLKRLAESLI
jgi:hypothetical protein